MLQDRRDLETILQNRMVDINQDKTVGGVERKKDVIKEIHDKYNIPIDVISDILNFRKGLSEISIPVLFSITDIIAHTYIKKYFTKSEIDLYENTRYTDDDTLDVIVFKMVQVADDQWIGATTVERMMALRNQQMIHYNGDTQRALQHVIRHGNEILQPYLNIRAVTTISDQYRKGDFIPNTITLNMPEEAEYNYNDKTNELTIYTEYFDITDGYHRYVAMGNVYDNTEGFDYPVELRITKFSTIRAQQFIYQEDQKTKMRKLDSKYYNPSNFGNMIVRKIDEDSNLRGKINNKDGLIDAPYLAEFVNKVWKAKSNKEVVEISKNIRLHLNRFTEDNTEYLDKKWSRAEIMTAFYGFYREIPERFYKDFINTIQAKYPDLAKPTVIKKKDLDILEKEVRRYV